METLVLAAINSIDRLSGVDVNKIKKQMAENAGRKKIKIVQRWMR
jgi:hypothetical protein